MSNSIFDQSDVQENKVLAILTAVFPILFFLVFCVDSMKNSAYSKHVANNSLVLFIAATVGGVLIGIIGAILGLIPVLGLVLVTIISGAFSILCFVLWILNIIDAAQGTGKKLPIIGGISIIK